MQGEQGNLHKPKMDVGKITVVHGPMGSGKTAFLVRYIETHGRHSPVLFINHHFDSREDHDGRSPPWTSRSVLASSDHSELLNAVYRKAERLSEISDDEVANHSVIIIDEAQFFPDLVEGSIRFCETLGKDVVASGLLTDFQRKPFGQLLNLIGLADRCHQLEESLCDECILKGKKTPSLFSKRLNTNEGQIEIGKDNYRGVCRKCWIGEPASSQ